MFRCVFNVFIDHPLIPSCPGGEIDGCSKRPWAENLTALRREEQALHGREPVAFQEVTDGMVGTLSRNRHHDGPVTFFAEEVTFSLVLFLYR